MDRADEFSPWFPEDKDHRLEDLAAQLLMEVGRLSGMIPEPTKPALRYVVRLANCCNSNTIEGDRVLPHHADQAVKGLLSGSREQEEQIRTWHRKEDPQFFFFGDHDFDALGQLGANHMRTQEALYAKECPAPPVSLDFLLWAHRSVFTVPPAKRPLLARHWPDQNTRLVPGELRLENVHVGRFYPPRWQEVGELLDAYCRVYSGGNLSTIQRIIAIPAAHHRFVWIHPFIDGNGRVSRLLSDAMLQDLGLSGSLWSTWRAFAASKTAYWSLLQEADEVAGVDDGPGKLSMRGLERFCEYFLRCCIDQVQRVTERFAPHKLGHELAYEYGMGLIGSEGRHELHPKARNLLSAVGQAGELERGVAQRATGLGRAWASEVMRRLLQDGLLASDGPKGPVRLGFPTKALDRWIMRL